jgi:hypothetical protein
MLFIYLLGEGSWAETWCKERQRQPTNGQKLCSPLNGHKIAELTVLPIKRFALMKSYVIIDVIKLIYKGERMAPTNAKFIKRIIYEGFFVIALGAVICKKYRVELFIEVVDWKSTTRYS